MQAGDVQAASGASDLARRYRVDRPVVADEFIAGELVVIHFDTGTYHGIRGSGVGVWQLLDAGLSLGELLAELAVRHSGVDAAAVAAVLEFVAGLERQRLIVPCADAGSIEVASGASRSGASRSGVSGSGVSGSGVSQGAPFVAPELDTRDDLRDFLVLDPIHDVDERGWPNATADA